MPVSTASVPAGQIGFPGFTPGEQPEAAELREPKACSGETLAPSFAKASEGRLFRYPEMTSFVRLPVAERASVSSAGS